jgi:RHS repeat-associated protein
MTRETAQEARRGRVRLAVSARLPIGVVATLMALAAWLLGPGEGLRTAAAQCDSQTACTGDEFQPVIVPGCVSGCGSPWGMPGGSAGTSSPGATYHGPPNDYPSRGAGKTYGDHESLSHAHVVTPHATNYVELDDPYHQPDGVSLRNAAHEAAIQQLPPRSGNRVPVQTGRPAPVAAYQGDPGPGADSVDDPIDHSDGEFIVRHVDMRFPGFGVPFVLVRHYGSRRSFDGPLGAATDHSYNLRIVQSPVENCAGHVLFMAGNGRTIEFEPGPLVNGLQTFSAPPGVRLTLQALYSGGALLGYSMVHADGTVAVFDRHGLIFTLKDANDRGLQFTWDLDHDRLFQVHDSVGRDIEFDYDDDNRVIRVIEKTSQLHADYVYDDTTGELIQATDANGGTEVYEYAHVVETTSEGYIPEGLLVDACEQACAPSETSCHAGGVCEGYDLASQLQCRDGCATCLPNCVNQCDTQCEQGRDTCLNGDGSAAHPGCDQGCDDNCPTYDQAVATCRDLYDTRNLSLGNFPGAPPPFSPHDACLQIAHDPHTWIVDCHNLTPAQCASKGSNALTCVEGWGAALNLDCGCSFDGVEDVCRHGFMGETSGTCGCDPIAGCPSREDRGGCPMAIMNSCRNRCDAACANDCVDGCKGDCAIHQCLPACDVNVCNAQCDAQDYERQCNDMCVPECVAASHAFVGTEAPHFPEGPKYGYMADLNHNLKRILNADGTVRVENTYGESIGQPSFDAVITQRNGAQAVTLGYRDYEAEIGLVTRTPTGGGANTSLTADAPALSETLSSSVLSVENDVQTSTTTPDLAAQYTVPFNSYETADLCPERCMRSPTPGPAVDFLPTTDGIVTLPQLAGSSRAGGLASTRTFVGIVPPTLFPVVPGAGTSVLTQAAIGGALPSNWPVLIGQLILLQTDSGGMVTVTRNAGNTLTVSGSTTLLDSFRAAGAVTLVTDVRGYLHIYPGRPQSFIHLAAGTCSDPFRGELNPAGQLQLTPATACTPDLSVSPMASLVTDTTARTRFLNSGSVGLANSDLFASTALMNGRWLQRWRAASNDLPGRYELAVGAGEGAAPSSLSARVATIAARTPLLKPIVSADSPGRPFYVFHLPKPLRPATNTSAYAWDKEQAFDAREVRTDCADSVIADPIRGHGLDAPGASPARATVVMDAYGVAWTFYYDRHGRQIREVNSGTHATRSYNYDGAHELIGFEDPVGQRWCAKYDGSGNLVESVTFPAPYAAGDVAPIRQRYEYQTNPSRLTKSFDPRDPTRVLAALTWDAKGNLLTARDTFGDETTSIPSEFGPPAGSIEPSGARTALTWDAHTGALASTMLNADGQTPVTTSTQHDAAGHPTVKTSALGAIWTWQWNGPVLESASRTADELQEVVSFTYDDNHWLKTETNGRYRVTKSRDAFGQVVKEEVLALDGTAAPAVTCQHLGFDGRVIEEVRPEGLRIKPQYDGEGRVVAVAAGFLPPDSNATWDDGCTTPVAGPEVDAEDIGKTYSMGHALYDEAGRVKVATDTMGLETRFEYDGFGRAIIVSDASQRSVRQGYDAAGRVVWRAHYDSTAFGLPYKRPDLSDPGLLTVVEYRYDEGGRIQQSDAWHFDADHNLVGDGRSTTTYAYDPVANSVTVTDDAGASTTQFYDGAGRPTSTVLPTQDRIETGYRAGGRWIASRWSAPTPSGFAQRETVLNALGEVSESYVVAGVGRDARRTLVSSLTYDAEGNLRAASGPSGLEFEANYDAFGRASTTTSHFEGGSQEQVTYLYNRDGRALARTSDGGGLLATTRMHYDSLGRPRSITRPDGGTDLNTYLNASDKVYTVYDTRGLLWVFDYNQSGQTAGIAALPAVNATTGRARRFSYDGLGRLIEARDKGTDYYSATDDIVTSFQWDSLSNKTLEWDTNAGHTNAISHVYDGRGLSVASSLGPYALTRTYDALGREDKIQAGTTILASFAYHGLGGPISRTLDSGAVTRYSYDPLGRVEGIEDSKNGSSLAAWRYEMAIDGVPRLAGLRKGSGSELASVFSVDRAGRLLGEEHSLTGIEGVQIDPLAMPTAANLGGLPAVGSGTNWRTYSLDGRSNWIERRAADPSLRTAPAVNVLDGYDTFGGATASFDDGGTLKTLGNEAYQVDFFGEVVSASKGSNQRTFTYDALGRRVRETDPATGATTRYTFDGTRRVAQVNADGTWLAAVDGAALDEHVALVSSVGQRHYLHQDRMHSVYLVTDQNANPSEWTSYTAYGEATLTNALGVPLDASAVGNRFGFQGQPYLASLGLVDMRSRLYRPSWGRFLATDRIGLAGGPNLYAFVGSAPLRWWDPMGFCGVPDAGTPDAAVPYEEPAEIVEVDRDGLRTHDQVVKDRDRTVRDESLFNQAMWQACKYSPCVHAFVNKARDEDRGMDPDEATAKHVLLNGAMMGMPGGKGGATWGGVIVLEEAEVGGGPFKGGTLEPTPSVKANPTPAPEPPAAASLRETYLGRTPGKGSRTGLEVQERMRAEGTLRDNLVTGKTEYQASDKNWYELPTADMAHRVDAVKYWNTVGRFLGAKAPAVRDWMLDSANYVLNHYSLNRSAGAKLGERYLPPYSPPSPPLPPLGP